MIFKQTEFRYTSFTTTTAGTYLSIDLSVEPNVNCFTIELVYGQRLRVPAVPDDTIYRQMTQLGTAAGEASTRLVLSLAVDYHVTRTFIHTVSAVKQLLYA